MTFDYLILDWSGVVSNDGPVFLPVLNKILAHFGRQPMTFPEFQDAYEGDIMKYWRKLGINEHEVRALFQNYFGAAGQPQPIRGAPRAIRMHSRMVRIGVFSSHPQITLEAEIERYQLTRHLHHCDGGVNKGNATDLKKHLHKARAKHPLYAGDTAFDIAIANELGIASAAVISKYGYHREEHFANVTPTFRVNHIQDLDTILRNDQKTSPT